MRIFYLGLYITVAVAMPAQVMALMEGALLNNSNLRTAPVVQQDNIIEVLPNGSRVQVLVQGQGWNLVTKDYTYAGWVAAWLMDVQEVVEVDQTEVASDPVQEVPSASLTGAPAPLVNSASVVEVEPEKKYGIVQLNSNMREGPMQAILQVVPKGSKVEILLLENKWYKVRIDDGSLGWIAEWLIDPVANNAEPQTASMLQQVGIVPASIDTQALNDYWAAQVNKLRSAAGLRLLTQSSVLANTAATWADYIGTIKQLTHVRANGDSMHEWAKAQGIPFSERYSANGWQENYFTENIGRDSTYANMDSAKASLDVMLANFVAEDNGPHYRTVYHEDWNSVGSGFYFDPAGNGTYQLFAVFHYASLAQESIY